MKNEKSELKTHLSFLIMILMNLFCFFKKYIYPYGHMHEWQKFNETTLTEKDEIYSYLDMEDITDADYMHAKRVWEDFEIKILGEYHDLYLESNTLLFTDVFKSFRKMYSKIYYLDSVKFSAPGLAWQAALKKNEVKLESLTDIDMLLMVEKGL